MTLARLEAVETFKTQAKPPVTPMWLGVASSIMTQWNVYALIKEDASILLLSNTIVPSGSIAIRFTPVSVQTRGLELGVFNVSKVLTHLFPNNEMFILK